MTLPISACFVFFKSTNLTHLDAAWYSLSRQRMEFVEEVRFLDNNTEFTSKEILEVLARYTLARPDGSLVPLSLNYVKHGDDAKTHSWSVNQVCRPATADYIFFTRSDYLLDFAALDQMYHQEVDHGGNVFISGHCYQMAYDRGMKPYPSFDIENHRWRQYGPRVFVDRVPGYTFHETDQDAGVWLCPKGAMERAGWMNEGMSSWGYQQSTFQRALKCIGTPSRAVPRHLFFHMAHDFAPGSRDFDRARLEYDQFGKGV